MRGWQALVTTGNGSTLWERAEEKCRGCVWSGGRVRSTALRSPAVALARGACAEQSSSSLQIIKDGEEHDDLNEVAKLFNIHED